MRFNRWYEAAKTRVLQLPINEKHAFNFLKNVFSQSSTNSKLETPSQSSHKAEESNNNYESHIETSELYLDAGDELIGDTTTALGIILSSTDAL